MKAKISIFVVCVEAIIYLLLHNLYDRTFKYQAPKKTPAIKRVLNLST